MKLRGREPRKIVIDLLWSEIPERKAKGKIYNATMKYRGSKMNKTNKFGDTETAVQAEEKKYYL